MMHIWDIRTTTRVTKANNSELCADVRYIFCIKALQMFLHTRRPKCLLQAGERFQCLHTYCMAYYCHLSQWIGVHVFFWDATDTAIYGEVIGDQAIRPDVRTSLSVRHC
jgi:hypothetical protein